MTTKTLKSKIRLCKGINIDRNYVNVTDYTENQMIALCESQDHLVASANDYSFIRNKGSISTSFSYSDALQSNYIAFQNKDYSNKWFFAWIDEVIYNGENNTEIKYTVDSWSTWYDYWTSKSCFVIREHVNDDTIGKNTIPENLDIGDVIEIGTEESLQLNNDYYYIVMTTYDPIFGDFVGVNRVNGNLFGSKIYAFVGSGVGATYVENFIKATNKAGKIESIQALFIAPGDLINNMIGSTPREGYLGPGQTGVYQFYEINNSNDEIPLVLLFTRITSYSDYTPKNNKCFVYPYNYILATNNVGNSNVYKYEDFILNGEINPNPDFELQLALTIGCSGRLVPKGYKNILYNYDESLPLGKYPTCAWASDAFISWLTSNNVNLNTSVALGLSGTILGLATGGAGVAVAGLSVAGGIANIIGQFHKASLLPSIQGGNNTGDVAFSSGSLTCVVHHMRCKKEFLESIDNYFTRFGYKVNKLKVPNITGRTYWNYVEIGQSEEIGYGDVPTKEMEIINNACRKGVTIWHNHANIGNYSLSNTIVT